MALLDSYSESNFESGWGGIYGSGYPALGQAFNPGAVDVTLDSVQFYMSKTGSPTGNAVAKVYAISGTYGTNAVPTGAALATSNNFDVSTLSGSWALATFTFGTPPTLTGGVKYFISVEFSGGDASNYPDMGFDFSPSHAGNMAYYISSWAGVSYGDACFYAYGTVAAAGGHPTMRRWGGVPGMLGAGRIGRSW